MNFKPKTREDMLSALADNVPAEIIEIAAESVIEYRPAEKTLVTDSEDDFEFTRNHVKQLITTSTDAIERMLDLAQDSEHPRAFEVLANLLKTSADVNDQLIKIHKDRRKLLEEPKKHEVAATAGNTTNNTTNAIFVGTTSGLQEYLSNRDKDKDKALNI